MESKKTTKVLFCNCVCNGNVIKYYACFCTYTSTPIWCSYTHKKFLFISFLEDNKIIKKIFLINKRGGREKKRKTE